MYGVRSVVRVLLGEITNRAVFISHDAGNPSIIQMCIYISPRERRGLAALELQSAA